MSSIKVGPSPTLTPVDSAPFTGAVFYDGLGKRKDRIIDSQQVHRGVFGLYTDYTHRTGGRDRRRGGGTTWGHLYPAACRENKRA